MSPSHTRRRGRIYRYYVTPEAIADGYDSCAVTSLPAADIEGAVLDQVQKLLTAPELVARTRVVAKREGDEITEREVIPGRVGETARALLLTTLCKSAPSAYALRNECR